MLRLHKGQLHIFVQALQGKCVHLAHSQHAILVLGSNKIACTTSQLQLLHESGLQMLMLMLMLVLMLAGHFSPFGHGQLVPGELLA